MANACTLYFLGKLISVFGRFDNWHTVPKRLRLRSVLCELTVNFKDRRLLFSMKYAVRTVFIVEILSSQQTVRYVMNPAKSGFHLYPGKLTNLL